MRVQLTIGSFFDPSSSDADFISLILLQSEGANGKVMSNLITTCTELALMLSNSAALGFRWLVRQTIPRVMGGRETDKGEYCLDLFHGSW
jgi:hypothetical protein